MQNFCPAAGSFNSFSRELALSQKSKITKPLSAMIFLSFVPTSPSITACAWSIYCCTKGLKVEKNSLGVKNRYSTMLSISTLYGRDFYLQKPLAQMLLLLLLFWWLLFVSVWLGFLRYLWWFHTQSSSMYSTASSPLLNTTWTSKKRNFSKLKSRIAKEF